MNIGKGNRQYCNTCSRRFWSYTGYNDLGGAKCHLQIYCIKIIFLFVLISMSDCMFEIAREGSDQNRDVLEQRLGYRTVVTITIIIIIGLDITADQSAVGSNTLPVKLL